MNYIEINKLSYSYGNETKKSLENIDLSINKGEILLVLGISGSGKSTLVKCLSGSIPNFYGGVIEGNVSYNGKPLKNMEHRERAKEISMVFQDPERQLVMDVVHREVAFSLENIGVEEGSIKRRVFEALQFLNLLPLAYKKVQELSGGEKQKVALASALCMNTNTIILDEPTSQLDPQSAEELVYLVKKINLEMGKTIIVVEQRVDKWFDIADEIAILDQGKLEFKGTKRDLYKQDIYEFLPQYLRIAKELKLSDINDFRQARKALGDYLPKELEINNKAEEKEGMLSKIKSFMERKERQESYLEIENISVMYENHVALGNVSLRFDKGKLYTILGENGAGKSTLLKSIMKLVAYKGNIKISGKSTEALNVSEIAKTVGYVSQNPNDYISKDTVYEEVKFTLDNFNITEYNRIDSVLESLNLLHLKDKNPRDLSGGEKQRLAIATVLVMQPEILLLDEPTRGLDYHNKEELGEILRSFVDLGKMVIMITHDVDFAAEYSDDLILLLNGEVIQKGPKASVLKEGIYYTSTVHKLVDYKEIYTIDELKGWLKR
ncbi:ABC transporter ATP-binding protein [Inconstantimicrobium mannanitabidum]|uniref:ABC transporter n=1 Tax=Inconstantimicrobium mannanitabidum TaxID=1604901 RepID=A0ACB5RCP6_9CLOT|nr:ABC transporter ATP-binding protein [Clostridium sp. TW13]GKX67035.1 ABC transporter [Clostridium sp. TW13]